MKVVQYYDRFLPLLGGVETHVENLLKMPGYEYEVLTNAIPGLSKLEKHASNAAVRRIGPDDRTIYPFKNRNISRMTFPYRVMTDIIRQKNKLNYLGHAKYDLLHVHGPALSMNLLRIDRKRGSPYFSKVVDFNNMDRPKILTMHGLFSSLTTNPFAEKFERRLAGMFETIICVDEFIQQKLISYGRDDVILIPNSLDLDWFKHIPHRNHEILRVGFIGRVEDDVSGLKILNGLARKNLPWLDFSVVGAGSPKAINNFKKHIRGKNVKFTPNLAQRRVPEYLSNIDVLLNPVMTGAITRVTLEAMACGRPVIMIGEKEKGPIINGETGFMMEKSIDSLVAILHDINRDREHLHIVGLEARRKIENEYTNKIIFPKIQIAYERAVS